MPCFWHPLSLSLLKGIIPNMDCWLGLRMPRWHMTWKALSNPTEMYVSSNWDVRVQLQPEGDTYLLEETFFGEFVWNEFPKTPSTFVTDDVVVALVGPRERNLQPPHVSFIGNALHRIYQPTPLGEFGKKFTPEQYDQATCPLSCYLAVRYSVSFCSTNFWWAAPKKRLNLWSTIGLTYYKGPQWVLQGRGQYQIVDDQTSRWFKNESKGVFNWNEKSLLKWKWRYFSCFE